MRVWLFVYGVFSYVVALIGQVWFILYLGEWDFLPSTINSAQDMSLKGAIVVNLLLALLFGLQHSIMAREWFKRWITISIPQPVERSTYVLFSGVILLLIVFFWEPIDGNVWKVESEIWKSILTIGFFFGWGFSLVATFIINHFELFGLEQVYLHLRGKPTPKIAFKERLFYKIIRHPIQLGVLMGLWITPTMSYGHFLLSLLFTIYIFVGLKYEERDLKRVLGKEYDDYQKRVGMLLPKVGMRKKS